MKRNQKEQLLSMVEGAIMLALAVALDYLCKLIPFEWPFGGGITVAAIPLIYYTLRRGTAWGLGAGFVYAVLQIVTGWYAPPAGTLGALVACVLLDYFIAFSAVGLASLIARPFGNHRLLGFGVACAGVHLVRFAASFLSGGILWASTAPESFNPWVWSLYYNGSYMFFNAVICTVLTVLLCAALDPKTLRPMSRKI